MRNPALADGEVKKLEQDLTVISQKLNKCILDAKSKHINLTGIEWE